MGTSDIYPQYPSAGAHNVMYATPCYTGTTRPQFSCAENFRRQEMFPSAGAPINPPAPAEFFTGYHDKFYYPNNTHTQVNNNHTQVHLVLEEKKSLSFTSTHEKT